MFDHRKKDTILFAFFVSVAFTVIIAYGPRPAKPSVTAELAKQFVEPARVERQEGTFTVVSAYQEEIPGFQRVVLLRAPFNGNGESYFAGLASKDYKFEKGQEVEILWVNYVHSNLGFRDRFFLVRPRR